ncbi:MAG: trigger factor [Alphaproteobacteria bacterium]
MQVTELEKDGLKSVLKVVVPASQIENQIEAELKTAGERVKIPGFRPGFIPLKVLKQRYGKSVHTDVIKQLVNGGTIDALRDKKIRPAATPQVKLDESYEEGKDLEFTVTVESFPPVPDLKFDNVTLARQTYELDDATVDEAAERIAKNIPNFEREKEGTAAKKGHVVNIDFKGMIDGKAFDGGTAKGFRLELGSGQFIEGFEDQLTGAKEGDERDVKVTFPAQYHAASLAGKPAVFEVKVNEIFRKETPRLDDEFAKGRGFADLRALREAIRDQLMKEYDQVVRTRLKKQLFDHFDDELDFELPQSMVDMEFKSIWERIEMAKKEGDKSLLERTDDELKEEYGQIARRRVKLGIMLAEVGSRNKIEVTRQELQRAAYEQASMYPGQEQQVMEYFQQNPDRMEDLRGPILEEKAVDHILSKVKYNDTKVSIPDLLKEEDEDEKASSGSAKKAAKKSQAKKKSAKQDNE